MNRQWISVAVVWVFSAVCVVLVGLLSSPGDFLAWIGLSAAGCTIVTLCIQLASGRPEGYVNRVTASIVGAVIVLSAATGVFALLGMV